MVDKNQPLDALHRTSSLCILHRFPALLIIPPNIAGVILYQPTVGAVPAAAHVAAVTAAVTAAGGGATDARRGTVRGCFPLYTGCVHTPELQ